MVLRELVKLGNEVTLYTSSSMLKASLNAIGKEATMNSFREVEKYGVHVHESIYDMVERLEINKTHSSLHKYLDFARIVLGIKSYESYEDLYYAKRDSNNIQDSFR